MLLFNPGTKENAGVFCQPQGWAILAEALLGHGERAYRIFTESSPAAAPPLTKRARRVPATTPSQSRLQ